MQSLEYYCSNFYEIFGSAARIYFLNSAWLLLLGSYVLTNNFDGCPYSSVNISTYFVIINWFV